MQPLKNLMIIFFLLVNGYVFSRDIYVAKDGNDDINDGSLSQPYLSINKAASMALAGDVVTIKSGTYYPATRIVPANSGTSVAPIIYRAEVKGEVIIDGSSASSPTSADRLALFNIVGTEAIPKSWIIVDGLRIINSAWAGFSARFSDHITFENCSTFNTGASGIVAANSSNITVLRNVVQQACVFPSTAQGTSECITMASVNGFDVGYNSVSDRMTDLSNGGEGIDAKNASMNGKIHHNTVFNLIRVGIYVDAYQRDLSNVEVYANEVYSCIRGGITVASEEGGVADGIKIHDNMVYNISRIGIRVAGYLNNGPLQNIDIYQNTVFNCGFGGVYENAGLLLEASNNANYGINIRNNIVSGCPRQIKSNNSQNFPVSIDNNLFFGAIGSFSANTAVTNTINADPLFMNSTGNNFRLQAASPAIDRAVGSPTSVEDITGLTRPVDGLSDLGAFEYNAALPVTLLSFTASRVSGFEKTKSVLMWSTAAEINVSEYIVEKSLNGFLFFSIGTVPAKNARTETRYNFDDPNLESGVQYYRLKMLDNDGSYVYSRIVAVQQKKDEFEKITIFPNPATTSIIVQHKTPAEAGSMIRILSTNGTVISQSRVTKSGMQTDVDVSKLPVGSYILIFEASGKKSSAVFMK